MDNNKNQARKTKRLVIFSENDKKYLKGIIELDTKNTSKFHKNLDRRFDALRQDLELIARSDKLSVWRSHNRVKLEVYSKTNVFEQMLSNSQLLYVDVIRHKKSGKRNLFWVDMQPRKNNRTDLRSLDPQFLLRKMYGPNKEKFGVTLIDAYKKGFIPTDKDDAISETKLISLLNDKTKLKIHKKIELPELEKNNSELAKKYRKAQKIINNHRKKLNEQLKPLGLTMGQMSYI